MSVPGLITASVLFLAGLVGTFLPVLPGAILIFTGAFLYGFIVDFQGGLDLMFYLGQGAAVLIIFLIDYTAGIWGARKFGGSPAAVIGSIAGLILGLFTLGPFGIIIGPFIGAFAGEYLNRQNVQAAMRAAMGTAIGIVGGTALKLAIEIVMIVWFFMVVF